MRPEVFVGEVKVAVQCVGTFPGFDVPALPPSLTVKGKPSSQPSSLNKRVAGLRGHGQMVFGRFEASWDTRDG